MSAFHGVGPTIIVVGSCMALLGFAGWARLGSPKATDTDGRLPRLAAFNLRASRVMNRIGWLGVPVLLVELIVWAAQ